MNNVQYHQSRLVFIVFLIVPFIYFFNSSIVVPQILSLGKNFTYSAEVTSIDNFYDSNTKSFTGDSRSVTNYYYQVGEINDHYTEVINNFDVRTVTGEEIVSIQREYYIEPKSWRHYENGVSERSGYLFAPRYLDKQARFQYWHVNYNMPLDMVYLREEYINGLKLYVFATEARVDQTRELSHLEGVPEKYGIDLDMGLKLWIEPVSGWVVKYSDEAIAFYYDQNTGERLYPWNKFKNTLRKNSVDIQVQKARTLKAVILLINYLIPLLVLVIGLSIILNIRLGVSYLITITISLAVISSVAGFSLYRIDKPNPRVTIGVLPWVSDANPLYSTNIAGFKSTLAKSGYHENRDVEYIKLVANADVDLQNKHVNNLLSQGVDLIYSLTTPGTQIVKDANPIVPVVFSIVTYPVEAGLIASLHGSGNNFVGTRNWIPVSQQLDYFLELMPNLKTITFLHRRGEVNSSIQLNNLREYTDTLGIQVVEVAAVNTPDLLNQLNELSFDESSAIYSACDTLVQGDAELEIIEFIKKEQLPSFTCNQSGVQNGDLLGVVSDFFELGELAGSKAVLVLEGATPASLETNTITRPKIILNYARVKELGLNPPQSFLIRVDEIIR